MMDWLVGVKPAVMKPEMEIHSPWKNARTGSIPATKQNSMSKTVAIPITASEILLIRRVVVMTLGTTCSLRPSEEYNPDVDEESRPSESAITIRPIPPRKCMIKRHMLSA